MAHHDYQFVFFCDVVFCEDICNYFLVSYCEFFFSQIFLLCNVSIEILIEISLLSVVWRIASCDLVVNEFLLIHQTFWLIWGEIVDFWSRLSLTRCLRILWLKLSYFCLRLFLNGHVDIVVRTLCFTLLSWFIYLIIQSWTNFIFHLGLQSNFRSLFYR